LLNGYLKPGDNATAHSSFEDAKECQICVSRISYPNRSPQKALYLSLGAFLNMPANDDIVADISSHLITGECVDHLQNFSEQKLSARQIVGF
jgi:hypothetical protein